MSEELDLSIVRQRLAVRAMKAARDLASEHAQAATEARTVLIECEKELDAARMACRAIIESES